MIRRAIVVGASSGIGREVAERLIQDGWQVAVVARRLDALQSISHPSHTPPTVARIDITAPDADKLLRQLIEKMGGVDLYFHASGYGKQNTRLSSEIEMKTVETNATGFVRMIGEAFRWMAADGGGHIAVISSIAGTKGLAPAPSYSATKAFQNTYIQSLEQLSNCRKLNIRFTDLRPGFVDTDFIKGSHFPMMLDKSRVADEILRAVYGRQHVRIIDWKWRILVALWQLTPRFVWRKLPLLPSERQ